MNVPPALLTLLFLLCFALATIAFYAYGCVLLAVPASLWWIRVHWTICVLSVLLLLIIPKVLFGIMAHYRRIAIVESLPDALQQMGGALRAGATFNAAVQSLVAEREGPMSQELSLMLREQRLGIRVDESLENLGDRVKSEEMDIVVSAILIAQDVGGNLAEVLSRLADSLRAKITMEGRIKSLTAQGVMQGYVVTALPTFVMLALLLVEREAIMPLFTSLLGWIFLTIIVSLQLCGGVFIRKIVSIDI